MNRAALIDANIPMYAFGGEHALKEPCVHVLELVAERPELFVTNSEVLQEILHRYRAMQHWGLGRGLLSRFAELMRDRIEPVYAEDVQRAAALADSHPEAQARDLVHAAVAQRIGVLYIISADRDFDRIPGVTRLAPDRISEWASDLMPREA